MGVYLNSPYHLKSQINIFPLRTALSYKEEEEEASSRLGSPSSHEQTGVEAKREPSSSTLCNPDFPIIPPCVTSVSTGQGLPFSGAGITFL